MSLQKEHETKYPAPTSLLTAYIDLPSIRFYLYLFISSLYQCCSYASKIQVAHLIRRHVPELHQEAFVSTLYVLELFDLTLVSVG